MGYAQMVNFGGGGNKPDYYLRVTVTLSAGEVQPTDGFLVSATKDGETVSGNTDSTGVCTLMIGGTGAYTVEVSHTGYQTQSSSIAVVDVLTTTTIATQYLTYTVTGSITDGSISVSTAKYKTALSVPITPSTYHDVPASVTVTIDGTSYTGFTYTTGTVSIPGDDIIGDVVITGTCPPQSFAVTKNATGGTWSTGGTTATYGTDYQATLVADTGFALPTSVTVTVGGSAITPTWDSATGVLAIGGSSITGAVVITAVCKPPYVEGSVSFNAEMFKTDPKGCLTYGGDLAGKTPVSNSGKGLHTVTEEGDWGFDMTSSDIDKKGTNMFGMFYCTFTSAGVRHEKLDPYNLAQKIATWDDTNKKWTAESGASSITTENTMLMIPTLYWKGDSAGFTITQSSSSGGTAYAHTVGGKTYKYLAIGVYGAYTSGSKMMSLSGVVTTARKTREVFRTEAQANTVSGGLAMQWNFHQYQLMRFLSYLSCKSFNCQLQIGNGGNDYSSGVTGGCNALGPYAGDVSGTASSVKCLIEDFWGYKYQFVDDCNFYSDGFYVGQNAPASITDTTSGKIKAWAKTDAPTSSGFPASVLTTDLGWGIGKDAAGDKSKGLCDYNYITQSDFTTSYYLLRVGGYSECVSVGKAGPGCVHWGSLAGAVAGSGSRLAFVLD